MTRFKVKTPALTGPFPTAPCTKNKLATFSVPHLCSILSTSGHLHTLKHSTSPTILTLLQLRSQTSFSSFNSVKASQCSQSLMWLIWFLWATTDQSAPTASSLSTKQNAPESLKCTSIPFVPWFLCMLLLCLEKSSCGYCLSPSGLTLDVNSPGRHPLLPNTGLGTSPGVLRHL